MINLSKRTTISIFIGLSIIIFSGLIIYLNQDKFRQKADVRVTPVNPDMILCSEEKVCISELSGKIGDPIRSISPSGFKYFCPSNCRCEDFPNPFITLVPQLSGTCLTSNEDINRYLQRYQVKDLYQMPTKEELESKLRISDIQTISEECMSLGSVSESDPKYQQCKTELNVILKPYLSTYAKELANFWYDKFIKKSKTAVFNAPNPQNVYVTKVETKPLADIHKLSFVSTLKSSTLGGGLRYSTYNVEADIKADLTAQYFHHTCAPGTPMGGKALINDSNVVFKFTYSVDHGGNKYNFDFSTSERMYYQANVGYNWVLP